MILEKICTSQISFMLNTEEAWYLKCVTFDLTEFSETHPGASFYPLASWLSPEAV